MQAPQLRKNIVEFFFPKACIELSVSMDDNRKGKKKAYTQFSSSLISLCPASIYDVSILYMMSPELYSLVSNQEQWKYHVLVWDQLGAFC